MIECTDKFVLIMQAGRGCGLFSVAVPSKYSARGAFPYADAVMDSFGYGGGVTWSWLSRKIDSGSAGQNRKRRRWCGIDLLDLNIEKR